MVYGQLKYFENVLILLDFFANFKKTWKVSKLLNVIAMANTQKSNTTGLSPPQGLLNNLLGHYQNGRFSAAEKLSVKITQDFPKHQFAWKVLGAILGATGRMSEAADANQTAVVLSPQDAEAHNNLGVTLKELGRLSEAEASYNQAIVLNSDYAEAHNNLGATLQELERLDEAETAFTQAIALKPDYAEAHSNLGVTLQELGRLEESEASHNQAIVLNPNFAEAYYNLGVTLQQLGRLEDAETSYKQAIVLRSDYAEAHSNLGMTLQELGLLDEAESNFLKAITLKSDYADAFWNLHGNQKTLQDGEYWINKCLEADENHLKARLIKTAFSFYRGDKTDFKNLMQSELKHHPYMRSFSWAFSLPNLPELHLNKFYFFDAIAKKSIVSKPFYEFGVWRATSFKYLLKIFKKGYGFDTFTGLPEDWDVGNGIEKAGTYSSDGNVPKIKGGEFIKGKFQDTLPVFFSESRPIASVINFDADLYSSTIYALNFSKQVMDKDTILIFDEFIINESWEQDEFKALNEFCSINDFSYEVVAISFFTKQVAVKLIGI